MLPQKVKELLNEAVAAIEELGIEHGDIKDSNMIITPEGNLILLDFSHSHPLKKK
jgi:RIO-like serine/threonine protein kinase